MIYNYLLNFLSFLGFSINFFTAVKIVSEVRFFKIIDLELVSGNPPLLLIITAEPLLAASRLVRPNGSSHLEQTIEMLTFSKNFNTLS